jgi:hypothetical protein
MLPFRTKKRYSLLDTYQKKATLIGAVNTNNKKRKVKRLILTIMALKVIATFITSAP